MRLSLWAVVVVCSIFAGPTETTAAQSPACPPDKLCIPITVTAKEDSNPNASGRPSPVVIRLYQLKGGVAFSRAEYSALADDDEGALGGEFISREEFILNPGETRNSTITIASDTRVVGVTAGFRDLANAEWRGSLKTPLKGLLLAVERNRLRIIPD